MRTGEPYRPVSGFTASITTRGISAASINRGNLAEYSWLK